MDSRWADEKTAALPWHGGRIICSSNSRFALAAFSLIELLVVIAIIGLLAVFVVPGLSSISTARGVTQAAHEVTGLLELARNEAVTRKTFVWMGFQPITNNGVIELRLGLVYSKDGSASVLASNLQPLSRAITVQRVALVSDVNLGTNIAAGSYLSNGGMEFTIGAQKFNGRHTITFTPRGEAMLMASPSQADGFDSAIGIGLRETRGLEISSNKLNDILVTVDGSVGTTSLLRSE